MGLGVIGFEPQCFAVLGDGLLRLPLVAEGEAQVEVGFGPVGVEHDDRASGGDSCIEDGLGFLGPAPTLESFAQAREVLTVLGPQPRHVLEYDDRLVRLPVLLQGVGQEMGHLGPERPHRHVVPDRLLCAVLAVPGIARGRS